MVIALKLGAEAEEWQREKGKMTRKSRRIERESERERERERGDGRAGRWDGRKGGVRFRHVLF